MATDMAVPPARLLTVALVVWSFALAPLLGSSGVLAAEPPSAFTPALVSDDTATRALLGPLEADPPFLGEHEPTIVRALVAWNGGFVAAGGSPRGAVAWRSTDGAHWRPVPDQATFDEGAILDLAVGAAGLVAVGLDASGCLATWTSGDGSTWERGAAADDLCDHDRIPRAARIAPLADGTLVAVARMDLRYVGRGGSRQLAAIGDAHVLADIPTEGEGGSESVVLRSPDGKTWERLGTGPTIAGGRLDLVATGAGWVAVGDGTVRVSDEGRTWRSTESVAPFSAIVSFDDRLVAAGPTHAGASTISVWTSTDGEHWSPTGVVVPGGTALLAATGAGLTLVAGAADLSEEGESEVRGTSVWTSRDGLDWQPLRAASLEKAAATALATSDDRTVIAGTALSDGEPVAAAWTLPAVPIEASRAAPARRPWADPPTASAEALGVTVPVLDPATARLPDGRLLVAGGYGVATDGPLMTVALLDVATGAVEDGPALPMPLWKPSVTTAADGSVHLVGSDGSRTVLLTWRPGSQAWEVASVDLGWAEGRSVALMVDGRVLIGPEPGGTEMTTWDPRSGRRGALTFPQPSGAVELVRTSDDQIVALTPVRAWRLDTDGSWIPGAPNTHLLPMSRGIRQPVFPLLDGQVAVLLGVPAGWCGPGSLRTVIDVYDPASDGWTSTLRLPQSRSSSGALQLLDGHLVVVGGTWADDACGGGPPAPADSLLVDLR